MVNADIGVMRGSLASRFFASTFGSGVGVEDGFGAAALITTTLFQTSLVPDLIQVNFFPPEVAVDPTLVHLSQLG